MTESLLVINPKDRIGSRKAPMWYVPPRVLAEVGLAMMEGALKYGPYNWRTAGVRMSVYIDAQHRHMDAFLEGQDLDPDSQLSHITKAIAGLIVLRDSMIEGNAVDDRPPSSTPNYMDALNEKASALVDKFNVPPAQSHEGLTFGPPADVWIEWTGGECPVPKQTLVLIKWRVGGQSNNWWPAREYRWNHAPNVSDIIAYMVMG